MIDCFSIASDIFFAETEAIALYLMGKNSEVFDKLDPSVSDLKSYLSILTYFSYCGLEELAIDTLKVDYGLSDNKAVQLLNKLMEDKEFKI